MYHMSDLLALPIQTLLLLQLSAPFDDDQSIVGQ